MFGVQPSGPSTVCRTHQSYSSSVSPFQAKTGTPWSAMAAAASSWVEKMLHDDQRTSAPRCFSVRMRTAVSVVMCRQPAMRAPFRGCSAPNSRRSAMSPGISRSARSIIRCPWRASAMSLTL